MERRSAPRVDAPFTVTQLLETKQSQETYFSAQGRNLSVGGMLVVTDYAVEPQSRIFTMLKLGEGADAPVVSSEGIVVHVVAQAAEYLCGVRFYDMADPDRRKLEVYLAGFSDDESA